VSGYLPISESRPTAKVRHRCIWCGGRIEIGERYVRQVGKWEGELQSDPWHLDCDEAGKAVFATGEDELSPYSNERPGSTGCAGANP